MSWRKMSKNCPKGKSRDARLKTQGWVRRFVADEPRLGEAIELYKSLGYEIRLEPTVFDEISKECRKCLLYQDYDKYKTVYIRPRKKRWKGQEETIIP